MPINDNKVAQAIRLPRLPHPLDVNFFVSLAVDSALWR